MVDSSSVVVQLRCLFLTPTSRTWRSKQSRRPRAGAPPRHLRDAPVFAFISSFRHIERLRWSFGAAGKTFEACHGEPDQSGYLSLPTVTLLPPGERPEDGRNQEKRMMGECWCHFLSVYKSRSLLEKHMKSTLDTPRFFFRPSSSSSSSLLPVSDLQSVY